MSTSTSKHALFDRSLGRPSEEESEVVEPRWIAFWKQAAAALRSRKYEHNGCIVTVEVDWAPYYRRLLKHYKLLAPVRQGQKVDPNWYTKLSQPLRLTAACTIHGENQISTHDWYREFFLDYYLYEIFLIANLACPGSGDFLGLTVESAKGIKNQRLGLSAYYFDEWLVSSIRGGKPSALSLDCETVAAWVTAVNPTVTQRADSVTQRALFALFHMCRSDGHIDFVVWFFNALEALLNTKVGENFSGMVRRASLVLALDKREAAHLSKKLRKLYDLRSSFVHGGYPVAHPLHHEGVDRRLDKDYTEILELSNYGFSVLAALMQYMVVADLRVLEFEERLVNTVSVA